MPAADLDVLTARLRDLRVSAGNPSYAAIARRIGELRADRGEPHAQPGKVTVYDVFRPGRQRLDTGLVLDVVHVLAGPERLPAWREALRAAAASSANVVPAHEPGVGADGVHTELPEPIALVGVEEQLDRLVRLDEGGSVLISGLPGVGKSELAVAAATQLAQRCELVLFVPMRGYHHTVAPRRPGDVLPELLRCLGLSARAIAQMDSDQRQRTARELLGRRRALVVLDDVSPHVDVSTLVPGGRARTIVTSRHALTLDVDVHLRLDVLAEQTAVRLLAEHVGVDLVAAQPDAARQVVQACSRLPVEIVVAAGSINQRPHWTLEDHAHQLRGRRGASTVRPALTASYEQLPEPARRVFRMLALHPPTEMSVAGAAALAGLTMQECGSVLGWLEAENLITRRGDRYHWHDVIRDYAHHVLVEEVPHSRQRDAVRRFLHAELAVLTAAIDLLHPAVSGTHGDYGEPDSAPQTPADAVGFFGDELATLLASADLAHRWDLPAELSDLSALLFPYLSGTAHLEEAAALHRLAADHGEPDRRSQALRHLARALEEQGHYRLALAELDRAIAMRSDEHGRAVMAQGNVYLRMGDYEAAAHRYEQAVDEAREQGGADCAFALGNLAEAHRLAGGFGDARRFGQEALDLFEELGYTVHLNVARSNLALVAEAEGNYHEALVLLESAAEGANEIGHRAHVLRVSCSMASVHRRLGEHDVAERLLDEVASEVGPSVLANVHLEVLSVRGLIRADQGRTSEARATLQEVIERGDALGAHDVVGRARRQLEQLDAAPGQLDAAAASR